MKKHVVFILIAGVFWGSMGVFVRELTAWGISSGGIAVLRCSLSCALFGITILISDRRLFRIKLKDIWCFFGAGVCSMLFFSYCYYTAIKLMSMSVASVLLYTAPSFVMLMSLALFKERLTKLKLTSLVLAFAGCCLVSGLGAAESVSAAGLLFGLGAGFGYALYSIFGRMALIRGYDSKTVNFHSCLFASVGAMLIWGVKEPFVVMFTSGSNILWCVALAVVSCYLPYLLYTYGLTGVETGRASIMASAEPVVATLLGVTVYSEKLTIGGVAGTLLVVGAIIILNLRSRSVPATGKNGET